MRSKFSFTRALSLALVAIGTVAGFSSSTFAAPKTWTGTASGTTSGVANAGKWGTSSVFAGNWNPSGNPTSTDTAVFNSNSNRTVAAVSGNAVPIGSMTFSGSGTTTFSLVGSSSIVVSGEGTPLVGISSTSTATQVFANKVVVNAPQMTFKTTNGGLSFTTGGLDLNGNYLKGEGTITTANLGSSVAGGVYEVVSGTQTLGFDATTGANVASLVLNGGVTSADGNSATDLSVQGGRWVGNGTFHNVSSTSGAVDLNGNGSLGLGGAFVQSAGGTTIMNINEDGTSSNVSGGFQLAGAFQLNASDLLTNLQPYGKSWDLFSGVNLRSGSAAPVNNASNFSTFAFTTSSSTSPYYGTWTRYGQEWSSPAASDGTYLVFQAATGNLVVVPEPSTMVFAGLGVAMSGWTMWKKRRLAKLLAAKAG